MRNYDYRGWHVGGTDDPNYHPATGRWRAESYGVTMSASDETSIRRMIDSRCEECPPNGHGARVETHVHVAHYEGEYELLRRRLNGKIYVQRWTEETAYQNSAIGYETVDDAIQALKEGRIEWASHWTPA